MAALGQPVAGIDEAGRGPLAGPVIAAAVAIHPADWPEGLDDSKKLSPQARARLFHHIIEYGVTSIAVSPPAHIDRVNILRATHEAMRRAAFALNTGFEDGRAPVFLVDGRDIPPALGPCAQAIIGGDRKIGCIAAASILAKVTRDAMMQALDRHYPQYGFGRHKGYGTAAHLAALRRFGATCHHRASFRPVREMMAAAGGKAAQGAG